MAEISVLERDEATLFKKFEAELLGSLARYTTLRSSLRSYRTFSWRYGFIRTARLSRLHYVGADTGEVLEALLTHPSGRFLEHLILGEIPPKCTQTLNRVLREHGPPTLVSVTIEDNWRGTPTLEWLLSARPQLRHLVVPHVGVEPIKADALETLRLSWSGHDDLRGLAQAKLPALKRLHLTLPLRESELLLANVLASALPALEHVSVRRWLTSGALRAGRPELMPQDSLARRVALAAAARKLPRLDLEMAIGVDGVNALVEDASTLGQIESLFIPYDAVAAEQRSRLERQPINILWAATPDEEELELDAIDRNPTSPP